MLSASIEKVNSNYDQMINLGRGRKESDEKAENEL